MAARAGALNATPRPGDLIRDGLGWLTKARHVAPQDSYRNLTRIYTAANDLAAVLPPASTERAAAESLALAYTVLARFSQLPAGARARNADHVEDALARLADRMESIMESLAVERARRIETVTDEIRAMPAYEPSAVMAVPPSNPIRQSQIRMDGPVVITVTLIVAFLLIAMIARSCSTTETARSMPVATITRSIS